MKKEKQNYSQIHSDDSSNNELINADEEKIIDQIIVKLETRISSGFVINCNKENDGNELIEEVSQEDDNDNNDDLGDSDDD